MTQRDWFRLFKPVICGRISGRVKEDVSAEELAHALGDLLKRNGRVPVQTGNRVECDDTAAGLVLDNKLYYCCGRVGFTVAVRSDGSVDIDYVLNFWQSWALFLVLYQLPVAGLVTAAILGFWRGALQIFTGIIVVLWAVLVPLTLIRQRLAIGRLLHGFR